MLASLQAKIAAHVKAKTMGRITTRIAILGMSIYFIADIIAGWEGVSFQRDIYILVLEYCFYLLVKSHGKFHCIWFRILALNIFITDLISYIAGYFNIMLDATIFLIVLSTLWSTAVLITISLGVQHYLQIQKKRAYERENNKINKVYHHIPKRRVHRGRDRQRRARSRIQTSK